MSKQTIQYKINSKTHNKKLLNINKLISTQIPLNYIDNLLKPISN